MPNSIHSEALDEWRMSSDHVVARLVLKSSGMRSLCEIQQPDRCRSAMRYESVLYGDYLLGLSDGRLQPRPKLSQWRGILAACFMFRSNDHLQGQTGKHLLRIFGDSNFVYSIGWRYIVLVDCRSSNLRMNHPSRTHAKSQIQNSTCFTSSQDIVCIY